MRYAHPPATPPTVMTTCALTALLAEQFDQVEVSTLMNIVSIQVPWGSAHAVTAFLESRGLTLEPAGQETVHVLGVPDRCTITAWAPAAEGARLLAKVLVPLDAETPGGVVHALSLPDELSDGTLTDGPGRRARQDVMRKVDSLVAATAFGARVELDMVQETLAVLIGDVLGNVAAETYEHWALESALTQLNGDPDLITVARLASR